MDIEKHMTNHPCFKENEMLKDINTTIVNQNAELNKMLNEIKNVVMANEKLIQILKNELVKKSDFVEIQPTSVISIVK